MRRVGVAVTLSVRALVKGRVALNAAASARAYRRAVRGPRARGAAAAAMIRVVIGVATAPALVITGVAREPTRSGAASLGGIGRRIRARFTARATVRQRVQPRLAAVVRIAVAIAVTVVADRLTLASAARRRAVGIRAARTAGATVVRRVREVGLAAGAAVAVTETGLARDRTAAVQTARHAVGRVARVTARATVVRIPRRDVRLAAIGRFAVAVGIARIAFPNHALTGRRARLRVRHRLASRRRVRQVADVSARAAVVHVGGEIGFTGTRALTVGFTEIALARLAHAVDALPVTRGRVQEAVLAAGCRTATAVVRVGLSVDLAAVGGIVVAVGIILIAGDPALAIVTRRRSVRGGARGAVRACATVLGIARALAIIAAEFLARPGKAASAIATAAAAPAAPVDAGCAARGTADPSALRVYRAAQETKKTEANESQHPTHASIVHSRRATHERALSPAWDPASDS